MITAIVFVQADTARIPEVADGIAALPGVTEVYSVTGTIDLIAIVRVRDNDAVADGRGRPAEQGRRGASTPRPTSRSRATPGTTSRPPSVSAPRPDIRSRRLGRAHRLKSTGTPERCCQTRPDAPHRPVGQAAARLATTSVDRSWSRHSGWRTRGTGSSSSTSATRRRSGSRRRKRSCAT